MLSLRDALNTVFWNSYYDETGDAEKYGLTLKLRKAIEPILAEHEARLQAAESICEAITSGEVFVDSRLADRLDKWCSAVGAGVYGTQPTSTVTESNHCPCAHSAVTPGFMAGSGYCNQCNGKVHYIDGTWISNSKGST